MKKRLTAARRYTLFGAFVAGLAAPSALPAQANPDSLARAQGSPEIMRLVEPRSERLIRQELEDTRASERSAAAAIRESRRAYERSKGLINIQKKEIDTQKARIDLAKKEEREGDRIALESDRARARIAVRLMERTRDLHEAERLLQESKQNYARTRILYLESEARLAALQSRIGADSANTLIDPDVMVIKRQLLTLQRRQSERLQDMASRERAVADRKLQVLEAQIRWVAVRN